jgi:hypothetical protein
MRATAYSAPGIGTVTPFSNNGEYTSFPIPFRENPLPDLAQIIVIDQIASRVNAGRVVDMPNGTAFCMYVTRACLDAIGPLSTNFGRGYYEDVELCLRAARAGFRNVCATDVYVGHAGSKSFGNNKRALVTRNLVALEAAYPHYRAISAAFMTADPLGPARRALEAAWHDGDGWPEPQKLVRFPAQTQKHNMASAASPTPSFEHPRLGVIGNTSAATLSLVTQIAGGAGASLDVETVYIGATFDDMRLMVIGRLFCTGKIDPGELPEIIRLYCISHLLIVDEDAAGADEATTAVHGAAIARIVPTAKRIAASGDGLVIPCDASVPEMIAALNRWTMRYPEAVHG